MNESVESKLYARVWQECRYLGDLIVHDCYNDLDVADCMSDDDYDTIKVEYYD